MLEAKRNSHRNSLYLSTSVNVDKTSVDLNTTEKTTEMYYYLWKQKESEQKISTGKRKVNHLALLSTEWALQIQSIRSARLLQSWNFLPCAVSDKEQSCPLTM